MPVDTLEMTPTAPTGQEQVVPMAAPKLEATENPSDEVLELIKENSEDTKVATDPAAETGGLWNVKQSEALAVQPVVAAEKPAELTVVEKPVEAPISMDSSFTGVPGQTKVETAAVQADLSKYADKELKTVGEIATDDPFEVTVNTPVAENLIQENQENPNRGIHHEMDPKFKEELTADIEKGIEKADEKLDVLLARLKEERDGLRERALREKEEKAGELNRLVEEKETARQELLNRHESEKKELNEHYDLQIQNLTDDLTGVEQVLSEI